LREHIAALDQAGLLVKIDEQINKDTELMPLVRWQFRAIAGRRAARVYVYPTSSMRRGVSTIFPVVVGTLAASRQIYGFGLQCKPWRSFDRWNQAQVESDCAKDRRAWAGA
jgi:4-hydroxy-3-polyprenylbenzoate decarboxylase